MRPFSSAISHLLSRCLLWKGTDANLLRELPDLLARPNAVICLFEQSPGAQVIYGRPDPNMQQRTIKSLSEDIDRLKHQSTGLKMELREARSDNHRLRRRNAELEALIT